MNYFASSNLFMWSFTNSNKNTLFCFIPRSDIVICQGEIFHHGLQISLLIIKCHRLEVSINTTISHSFRSWKSQFKLWKDWFPVRILLVYIHLPMSVFLYLSFLCCVYVLCGKQMMGKGIRRDLFIDRDIFSFILKEIYFILAP